MDLDSCFSFFFFCLILNMLKVSSELLSDCYNRKEPGVLQKIFKQQHPGQRKGREDQAQPVDAVAVAPGGRRWKAPKDDKAHNAAREEPAEGAVAFESCEQPGPQAKEERRTTQRNLVSHVLITNGKKPENYKVSRTGRSPP
jgi:hypothetical protein